MPPYEKGAISAPSAKPIPYALVVSVIAKQVRELYDRIAQPLPDSAGTSSTSDPDSHQGPVKVRDPVRKDTFGPLHP
jgi:hypothetical protein